MTVYRCLTPAEQWRYAAHLLRLSAADRRARFMGALADEAVLAHVKRIDWTRSEILAALVDGEVRAAVELRREQAYGGAAELAVSVETAFQGQGLGKTLVARLLILARNRGVRRLSMLCLGDNRRMQAIARRLLGRLEYEMGEVTSTIDLPLATPFTLVEEAMDRGTLPMAVLLDRLGQGRAA
ncbi:GNAT family N-acetyltransferase [Oleisolibacter albus]|uniref:GNAT family N-acetyltransferase n=1 Tax=Oleisolibacter albus TaxID=2171757 RepID=UPI001390261F|nr:GNAT family N-acetyltransferase [Oleisolibacter albus]